MALNIVNPFTRLGFPGSGSFTLKVFVSLSITFKRAADFGRKSGNISYCGKHFLPIEKICFFGYFFRIFLLDFLSRHNLKRIHHDKFHLRYISEHQDDKPAFESLPLHYLHFSIDSSSLLETQIDTFTKFEFLA